jgi:hypothetical protein
VGAAANGAHSAAIECRPRCDWQTQLPTTSWTLMHAHAITASTRLRASQQVQQLTTPGKGNDRTTKALDETKTWYSHPAGPQEYSEGTERALRMYSAGTQRVLSGYSRVRGVEGEPIGPGVSVPVGEAGWAGQWAYPCVCFHARLSKETQIQ